MNDQPTSSYRRGDVVSILLLSLYCLVIGVGALLYLVLEYQATISSGSEAALLQLIIVMGVLGSILRAVEVLFSDVGRGVFAPRWSLSLIMRPLEGAIVAVLALFGFRAVQSMLGTGPAEANPFAFLTVAGLVGMFSHEAAQGLRNMMIRLLGGRTGGATSSEGAS